MSQYSILDYAVLANSLDSSVEPEPYRRSSNAILADGSVLVAAHFEDAPGYAGYGFLRVWHLSPTLAVLGTLDIPTPTGGDSSVMVADGSKALLALKDYASNVLTWEIDGAGAAPTILTSASHVSISYGYDYFATPTVRLLNGLAVVAMGYGDGTGGVLQLFSGSALLSEIDIALVNDITGLWVSLTDSDHIAVTGRAYASGYSDPRPSHWQEYVVSETGFVLVTDNLVAGDPDSTGYSDSFVALASGSPFLPTPTILGIDTPDTMVTATYQVRDFGATTTVATVLANDAGGNNGSGQFIPGLNGRYATFASTYTYPDPSGQGQFVAVDPTVVPPAIEILTLPVTGLAHPGISTGLAFIDPGDWQASYSLATGVIAISATVKTNEGPNYWSVVVWLIQGPANTPDLSGRLLEDRVRFTGV